MESRPPRRGEFFAFFSGLIGLAGVGLFLGGILSDQPRLWIPGGIAMATLDALAIRYKAMKWPGPLLIAIPFLLFIRPWYLALFWCMFLLHVLGVPDYIYKVLFPWRVSERSWRQAVARVEKEEREYVELIDRLGAADRAEEEERDSEESSPTGPRGGEA